MARVSDGLNKILGIFQSKINTRDISEFGGFPFFVNVGGFPFS